MKRTKTKYPIRVITDETQVPSDYITVQHWTGPEYELIVKAAKHGAIPCVKLMRTTTDRSGPVYVHEQFGKDFLTARAEKEAKKLQRPARQLDLGESTLTPSVELQTLLALQNIERLMKRLLDVWTPPYGVLPIAPSSPPSQPFDPN